MKGIRMEEWKPGFDVYYAAAHGDRRAQEALLSYYDSYLNALSMVKEEDHDGNIRTYIDEDAKAEAQIAFIEALPKCKVLK